MGMNNRDIMDAFNAKRVFSLFNGVYDTGLATKAFDWELIHKDGSKRYVEVSVSLKRDLKGHPIGFMGIIILIGIVVNNAILLVHQTLYHIRGDGMDVGQAIETATQNRIRPIFMSTLTSVVGMLPLALGLGEGAEMLQPLAVTILLRRHPVKDLRGRRIIPAKPVGEAAIDPRIVLFRGNRQCQDFLFGQIRETAPVQ